MSPATNATPRSFPEGFLWGTATASYQIEGAAFEDGRIPSIWDTFSRTPGKVLNGDTGDIACDHYHRVDADLDLLAELGVEAYRFSIAWPRVITADGAVNDKGVAFYKNLVAGLKARNIKPVVTLYHWDLPQHLEDNGGWVVRSTVDAFEAYVKVVVDALGADVYQWITLNEPWCATWLGYAIGVHAPGLTDLGKAVAAHHHMMLGHGRAVNAIKAVVPAAQVGITLNLAALRPMSDNEEDMAAYRRFDGNQNRIYLDPLFKGSYPQDMLDHYAPQSPGFSVIQDGDLEVIAAPCDFLGINFYSPGMIGGKGREDVARSMGYNIFPGEPNPFGDDMGGIGPSNPRHKTTAMGWEIDARGLNELLTRVSNEYTKLPIVITENGMACHDYVNQQGQVHDADRIEYINQHLSACLDALDAGVNLAGYFVWSFMDNYEWALGYGRRFGVTWVDFDTQRRIPKDSFYWYQNVIRTNEVPYLTPDQQH
jgi:beta-glucosidase